MHLLYNYSNEIFSQKSYSRLHAQIPLLCIEFHVYKIKEIRRSTADFFIKGGKI